MKDELAAGARREHAIEKNRMQVRVEPQVACVLCTDRDGSALSGDNAVLAQRPTLPAEHGVDEDAGRSPN
jgi:hypothetical protein